MCVPKAKVYGLEYDLCPLYLCPRNIAEKENLPKLDGIDLSERFGGKYVLLLSAFLKESSFAENIWINSLLEKKLKNSLAGLKLQENVQIITTLSYSYDESGKQSDYEEGFALIACSSSKEDSGDVGQITPRKFHDVIKETCLDFSIKHTTNICLSENKLCLKTQLENLDNITEEIIPVNIPTCHPAFVHTETNSIYHSLDRVYEVLSHYKDRDDVKELLEICNKYIKPAQLQTLKPKNSVIVIEGLDATGKTTLTKNLGKKLNATILKSPPQCICHLRAVFDAHPQLIRRAYYCLGNYAFATMICEAAQKGPVICDRYWNSTAAYALATDVKVGDSSHLPPAHHPVYSWPSDLLKPDAIFLLTITDEVRRARLSGRNSIKTDEELRLEKSRLFRERLEMSYKRMENPSMEEIDASGTPEEVCQKTIQIIERRLM